MALTDEQKAQIMGKLGNGEILREIFDELNIPVEDRRAFRQSQREEVQDVQVKRRLRGMETEQLRQREKALDAQIVDLQTRKTRITEEIARRNK